MLKNQIFFFLDEIVGGNITCYHKVSKLPERGTVARFNIHRITHVATVLKIQHVNGD